MMAALIRSHWPAALIALICALIVTGPIIVFPLYAGSAYKGINIPPFGTDQHAYLSRAKEVLEGKPLGDPFLAEGKTLGVSSFSSFETILTPLRWVGAEDIDVPTLYNTLCFIGIFALALLLYGFTYRLSGDRWLALAVPIFVLCGHHIVETRTLFYPRLDIYGRSPFPWASSLLFFGYVWALYEATTHKNIRAGVLAALLLGLSCYAYFYAWTFGFGFAGALLLIYIAMREWHRARTVFAIALGAALVGAPVLYQLVAFSDSPLSPALQYFLWVVKTHAPVMSRAGVVTFVLLAIHRYLKADRNSAYIAALIAAGWIALNEQVLSGVQLQYGHYYWYFVVPISILVGAYLMHQILPARIRRTFAIGLIALAIVNGIGGQYRAFFPDVEGKLRDQDYSPILEKFRQLPKASVFTSMTGSYPVLVTIYTDDDLYWSSSALIYNVPEPRIEEVLLVYLYLNKPSRADPIGFLQGDLQKGELSGFSDFYTNLEGYQSGEDYYAYIKRFRAVDPSLQRVREPLLQKLQADYQRDFSTGASIRKLLLARSVRYILWDKRTDPSWDLSVLGPLTTLATSSDLVLYQLQIVK